MTLKYKSTGQPVELYDVTEVNGKLRALIFDKNEYDKNGIGWKSISLSKLLPIDIQPREAEVIAKSRLQQHEVIWATSDQMLWTSELYENAINHELNLMKKESEKNNE